MKYVSFLRGINVSGQKKIKMADLKALYEAQGFKNVVTYIQSGNVVFETGIKNIKTRIEKAIEDKYDFHVPIEIRTSQELKAIIKNCPFGHLDLQEYGSRIGVTFLSAKPSKDRIADLQNHVFPPEELKVLGKEAYLFCPNGFGKTKLTNALLERKLGVKATARNLKTVHKLYDLSR